MSTVESCPHCTASVQRCQFCDRTTCGLHLTLTGSVRQEIRVGVLANGGQTHLPGPLEYLVMPQSGQAYRCSIPNVAALTDLGGFDPLPSFRKGWETAVTACLDCRYRLGAKAVREAEDKVRAKAAELADARAAKALAEQQAAAQKARQREERIAAARPKHDAHRAARREAEQTDEGTLQNELTELDKGIVARRGLILDEYMWRLGNEREPTTRIGIVLASRIAVVEFVATLVLGIGGGRLLALRVLAVALVTWSGTLAWTQLYVRRLNRAKSLFDHTKSEWSIEGAADRSLVSPPTYLSAIAVLQALTYWAAPGHPKTSAELAGWLAVMAVIAGVAACCYLLPVAANRRLHARRSADAESEGQALAARSTETAARLASFTCPWDCVICKPWLLDT